MISNKRVKGRRGNEGVGLLAQFPDDIVYHILSFLPITDVVRTSVLSKSWIKTWKHIPTVDYQQDSRFEWDRMKRFLDMVASILRQKSLIITNTSTTTCPRKLRITVDTIDALPYDNVVTEKIGVVINVALHVYGVEEFQLTLQSQCYRYKEVIRGVSTSIYSAGSLTSLRLINYGLMLPYELSLYWPSLRKLHLESFSANERFFRSLGPGCPLLESVAFIYCVGQRGSTTDCELFGIGKLVEVKVVGVGKVSIKDTPNLRVLFCKGIIRLSVDPLTAGRNLEVLELEDYGHVPELDKLFPRLKVFILRYPRKGLMARISSRSLEKLCLCGDYYNNRGSVSIHTPNLKSFDCTCGIPLLEFHVEGLHLERFDLRGGGGLLMSSGSKSCFVNMRKQLGHFKCIGLLNLRITSSTMMLFSDLDIPGDGVVFCYPEVKHLKIQVDGDHDEVHPSLVEGLSLMCRPLSMSLVAGLGGNNEFMRILCKTLATACQMKQGEDCPSFNCKVLWLHNLKDVHIECHQKDKETRTLNCDELLELLLPCMELGTTITFKFRW